MVALLHSKFTALVLHWEKILDWIKENYLFDRLSLIQRIDSFGINNICSIQTKYLWV